MYLVGDFNRGVLSMCSYAVNSACEVKSEWSCCGGSVRSAGIRLYNRAVGNQDCLV